MRLSLHALATCLGLALCAACDTDAPTTPSWPMGTALVIDGEPILASEVDADIEAMLDIKRAYGAAQRRRMILMHVVLPRAYARANYAEARESVLSDAREWLRNSLPTEPLEPMAESMTGNWDELGVTVWLHARDLEVGARSDVVELPGRFAVIRLVDRDRNANPAFERFHILIQFFPFVDHPESLIDTYSTGELEIVDPAWREIVPGLYKYKMIRDVE